MLSTDRIKLRTLIVEDKAKMLGWENDSTNWLVSQTRVPFSAAIIEDYINSSQDVFVHGQIRFVIEHQNQAVGCLDLFEYDPINQRVGVGILIEDEFRQQGFASEALTVIESYVKEVLLCHQIYCTVLSNNENSHQLFKKLNYSESGVKKDWCRTSDGWVNAHFYQKLIR